MRRIACRIAGLFAALVILPFPLGVLPGTHWLYSLVDAPFELGVNLLAYLLGIPTPSRAPTGSGDTTYAFVRLLLVAILAIVVGVAWALADRRDHPRLVAAVRVWMRYWLAAAMLLYGLVKVLPLQFDVPLDYIYDQRVGDKSPMGLLWLFMGYSRPYTMFAGAVEVIAGLLLLHRRTASLGAMVAAAAMTQVVMLNFSYDVPVKLYSLELLLTALALLAPDARRLITAALGRAVREVPPRPRSTVAFERARLAAKLFVLGTFAFRLAGLGSDPRNNRPPPSELAGAWEVTTCAVDGTERPPLTTDGERWARLIVFRGVASLRFMTDAREMFGAQIDERAHEILVNGRFVREVWTYERRGEAGLVIEGNLRGHRYRVELLRAPAPLLETRGFHWIQEQPFHR